MKQLSGYVLVKETNTGIPNLVVAAYDARGAESQDPGQRTSIPFNQRLGRRLGSVLTDGQGKFALSSEDLEFQGNEARPNVIVAVFAPEDIRSVKDPTPLPPEQRLLFLSSVARADAGLEEAFIIRLLQGQLEHFQIPTGDAQSFTQTAGSRLGDEIEKSWNASKQLRERFKDRIKAQVDAAAARRDRAREIAKKLSAIPRHLRDGQTKNLLQNNTLLIKHRSELPDRLAELQTRAINEGLHRLDKRRHKPKLRLYLTREELADLGLRIEKGHVAGSVNAKTLVARARKAMKGYDLIKVRGLNNPPPEELRRRYLTPPAHKPAAASVGTTASAEVRTSKAAAPAKPGKAAASRRTKAVSSSRRPK